ncbi:uroporphyrinogen-III synthase [Aliihoeflea sp. 40Bstr573]|uniref:uroporphyrinogen-III synthase n=1 Tax=Aliihoeflea sp. 40Bstr573 TaxID=2696467 RepID=UPI0020956930|nr:uroporphyrinogen-III synthase [Aliihoeflea sp. 40Bstr573]MCO6386984.1 uroporphyrinogen-III synthase [Aliihoeflea sp. 40Bstr573]
MARRVLVTRPEPGASATAARLIERGFEPVILPLTEIVPLRPAELPDGIDAIVATSANAFRHAPAAFMEKLRDLPLHVVGARTAKAAGRDVALVAPDARALSQALAGRLAARSHVVHLTGRVRRPELKLALQAQGHRVTEIELYDARAVELAPDETGTKLGPEPLWVALVYSQRGGEILDRIAAEAQSSFQTTVFVCISAEAAAGLKDRQIAVAAMPDEAGMLAKLAELDQSAARPHLGN